MISRVADDSNTCRGGNSNVISDSPIMEMYLFFLAFDFLKKWIFF